MILIPLLQRKQSADRRCSKEKAKIPLKSSRQAHQNTRTLGRLELLSAYYAACGCDTNVYSTQGKCFSCQRVKWASRCISRKMLRISFSKTGMPSLSVRGSHASVLVKDSGCQDYYAMSSTAAVSAHPSKWRGEKMLRLGTTICIQEPEGDGRLLFKFLGNNEKVVCILPFGQDLSRQRVALLNNRLLDEGVNTCQDYFQASHLVISKHVKNLASLAQHLNVAEGDLHTHLDEHRVQCLLTSWVFHCGENPVPQDFWLGYYSRSLKAKTENTLDTKPQMTPKWTSHTEFVQQPHNRRNHHLAQEFVRLSKAYEKAPLYPEEQWKALQFHKLAGRLQCLDFEVTRDNFIEMRPKLRKIPGLGNSGITMIQEVIACGVIHRTSLLENDRTRTAIASLMGIHGVGRVTALELYRQGYKSIEDIRHALSTNTLCLSREQLIGVDCYEDLLEDIPRSEVDAIGQIVIDGFHSISDAGAECMIMGSYRRGKATSGDVDVLITLKEFPSKVPRDALPKLIHHLEEKGHIAFHITPVRSVMDCEVTLASSNSEVSPGAPKSKLSRQYLPGACKGSPVTYMGVFYSPFKPGKRRRVDIKIYPYNKRGFAYLYFTGGKWFNRSMRLWATDRLNWKLSDQGIFDICSGQPILSEATCEEEVFKILGLRYKAPPERVYFDDVEPF